MSLYKVLGQVGHPGTAAGITRLTATKETVDEDPDVGFADANLGAATFTKVAREEIDEAGMTWQMTLD